MWRIKVRKRNRTVGHFDFFASKFNNTIWASENAGQKHNKCSGKRCIFKIISKISVPSVSDSYWIISPKIQNFPLCRLPLRVTLKKPELNIFNINFKLFVDVVGLRAALQQLKWISKCKDIQQFCHSNKMLIALNHQIWHVMVWYW